MTSIASQHDTIFYYDVFFPLVDFIGAVGIAFLIWYGGYRVMQHALTLGALFAFISTRFLIHRSRYLRQIQRFAGAVVLSHRIFKALDTRSLLPLRRTR